MKAPFIPLFILCNFHRLSKVSLFSTLPLYYLSFSSWNPRVAISYLCPQKVCFCWVPSHAGITDNERVDSLVHAAAILGCHHFMDVPTYDYFHSFRSFLFNRWQSFWSDLSNNKLCGVKPSVSPWSDPGHKNRRWETALARLRIGHTNLTHSYLMTQSPPTLCMTCNTLLSVPYILLFCPLHCCTSYSFFSLKSSISISPP